MTYRSDLFNVVARITRAREAGLVAAAQVLQNAVRLGLRGGYTSGAFVTGNVMNSVTRSEPTVDATGGEIFVGTNVDYAVFWEVGHVNPFTRTYQRKEVWWPAMSSTAEAQRAAYARVVARFMGGP